MSDEPPFALTQGEKASPLWARLTQLFEKELQSARLRNDNPQQSEHETATLRGKISTLKALIKLGADDRPQTE